MSKAITALVAAALAGGSAVAQLVGTTSSLAPFCTAQGGCSAAPKSRASFMGTPLTVQTMRLASGPWLSVGRVQGDMIITASVEVKKAVKTSDSKAMVQFIQAFSGKTVTPAQLSSCVDKLKISLRQSPGHARAPLLYAKYGIVEMSVECFARPLGDRSGYAMGVVVVPVGG